MIPGRKEIREAVQTRLKAHPHLLKDANAEDMMLVVMSNIGWHWNIEDVGRTKVHVGTIYEDDSAVAGLRTFIQECMKEVRGE